MSVMLQSEGTTSASAVVDRPGWIPCEVTENWDTDPYAYQTEEELMPAGGIHGILLAYMVEVLRLHLQARKLALLIDIFLLYRDESGIKQRVGPDLCLIPDENPVPVSYDLDERAAPAFIMEVASPSSRETDVREKVDFYADLGVQRYVVLDVLDAEGYQREDHAIRVWERGVEQSPDRHGFFLLPEIFVKVKAHDTKLAFYDLDTGEMLADMKAKSRMIEARDRIIEEKNAALSERDRTIESEKKKNAVQLDEIEKLKARLRESGQDF